MSICREISAKSVAVFVILSKIPTYLEELLETTQVALLPIEKEKLGGVSFIGPHVLDEI